MAGIQSKENGKKGGRPKGSKSPVTLKVEEAKAELIRMYIENIRPINEALIKKATDGDLMAIKELHDRVYGKSLQPADVNLKGELKIMFDNAFTS
jgi:hypothetical protein